MKVVKVRQGQGLGSNAVGSDSVGSNP
jgi:hypothetical protein